MPDSKLLEILVAAMVAGVILFRLYTVLGRRTGHEPGHEPQNRLPSPSPLAPAVLDARPRERAGESQGAGQTEGLFDIQLADPHFETNSFLKGARTAYEAILQAFASGDRAALKPLLSDEVYAAFDQDISQRGNAPAPESLAGITDARIAHAALSGQTAEITVAFRAQFAAKQGERDVQRDVNDIWTFARAIGTNARNWTLVATAGDLP